MKILYLLPICLFTGSLWAADPFYRQGTSTSATTVVSNQNGACALTEGTVAGNIPFNQLKVVGAVLYKTMPEAYFVDTQGQLFNLKIGERVGLEGYRLGKLDNSELIFDDICGRQVSQSVRF